MKFNIYADGELIGWSELSQSDPPMGIVFDAFFPSPGYDRLRALVLETSKYDLQHGPEVDEFFKDWFERFYKFSFTIVAEDGGAVDATGIQFTDFSDLPGSEDSYEVSLQPRSAEDIGRYFSQLRSAD